MVLPQGSRTLITIPTHISACMNFIIHIIATTSWSTSGCDGWHGWNFEDKEIFWGHRNAMCWLWLWSHDYTFVKIHQTVYLTRVTFPGQKSYSPDNLQSKRKKKGKKRKTERKKIQAPLFLTCVLKSNQFLSPLSFLFFFLESTTYLSYPPTHSLQKPSSLSLPLPYLPPG